MLKDVITSFQAICTALLQSKIGKFQVDDKMFWSGSVRENIILQGVLFVPRDSTVSLLNLHPTYIFIVVRFYCIVLEMGNEVN